MGVLFFNGRSLFGWGLTAIGALIIFAGIIANLTIDVQPGPLFDAHHPGADHRRPRRGGAIIPGLDPLTSKDFRASL